MRRIYNTGVGEIQDAVISYTVTVSDWAVCITCDICGDQLAGVPDLTVGEAETLAIAHEQNTHGIARQPTPADPREGQDFDWSGD